MALIVMNAILMGIEIDVTAGLAQEDIPGWFAVVPQSCSGVGAAGCWVPRGGRKVSVGSISTQLTFSAGSSLAGLGVWQYGMASFDVDESHWKHLHD